MTIPFVILFAVAALAASAQEPKGLALKKLPPAVQKSVEDEAKGATIKNISKETEHGVTQYEVETMLNGKHRDFNVDLKGAVVLVEEESALDAFPAAARSAILGKVGNDGKLGMVELVKKGTETFYEAAYTAKNGKKRSVVVKADGTETKI